MKNDTNKSANAELIVVIGVLFELSKTNNTNLDKLMSALDGGSVESITGLIILCEGCIKSALIFSNSSLKAFI